MKPTKVVIALGGNALEEKGKPPTAESQLETVRKTAEYLAEISCAGYEMAIVHGNGPQIGRILLAYDAAKEVTPPMPFDLCCAMSEGAIGYHIQQALSEALQRRNRHIPVVTVVTQVLVDPNDPAMQNPTKPIGPFFTQEEARKLAVEKHWQMKEDSGRGWRRVVPSPKPQGILEIGTMRTLWDTTISIACGGGGVPVMRRPDGGLQGVAAVIDKDLAAQRLAQDMQADILMILTEVDRVFLHFGTPEQEELTRLTADQAQAYVEQGHFAPGSMLPKVEAAIAFARSGPSRKAIITSLYRGCEALAGNAGTVICG
jgi:carbamate kinase